MSMGMVAKLESAISLIRAPNRDPSFTKFPAVMIWSFRVCRASTKHILNTNITQTEIDRMYTKCRRNIVGA